MRWIAIYATAKRERERENVGNKVFDTFLIQFHFRQWKNLIVWCHWTLDTVMGFMVNRISNIQMAFYCGLWRCNSQMESNNAAPCHIRKLKSIWFRIKKWLQFNHHSICAYCTIHSMVSAMNGISNGIDCISFSLCIGLFASQFGSIPLLISDDNQIRFYLLNVPTDDVDKMVHVSKINWNPSVPIIYNCIFHSSHSLKIQNAPI